MGRAADEVEGRSVVVVTGSVDVCGIGGIGLSLVEVDAWDACGTLSRDRLRLAAEG